MADPRQTEEALGTYGPLQEAFEREGGYAYAGRTRQVLRGLGLEPSLWDRPVTELSGGARARSRGGELGRRREGPRDKRVGRRPSGRRLAAVLRPGSFITARGMRCRPWAERRGQDQLAADGACGVRTVVGRGTPRSSRPPGLPFTDGG